MMSEGRKDKYYSLFLTKERKEVEEKDDEEESESAEEEEEEESEEPEKEKKSAKKEKEEKVVYEKDPNAFEVQYTLQGKLITSYEGVKSDKDDEDDEVDDDKDDSKSIDVDEDEEGDVDVYGEDVKPKDLPSKIQDYMKKNFSIEYKYKTCKVMKNEEFGEHYYIVMKKQGAKAEFIHYFDIKGNLLKTEEE
jgi:hypothetical protein